MNKIIKTIRFASEESADRTTLNTITSQYTFENEQHELKDLSKINLFVGSNNSGKSRLLRHIFQINKLQFEVYYKNLDEIVNCLKRKFDTLNSLMGDKCKAIEIDFKEETRAYLVNEELSKEISKEEVERVRNELNNVNLFVGEGEYLFKEINILATKILNMHNVKSKKIIGPSNKHEDAIGLFRQDVFDSESKNIMDRINLNIEEFSNAIDALNIFRNERISFQKVYVPTLRGLLPIAGEKDVYSEIIKEKYFKENDEVEVFTGLNLYEEITDMLLGDLEQRELIKEYQEFLSTAFFNNEEVLIIPKRKEKGIVYIKIGHEDEYPIYNLGDGIQSLIILTFPLFKYRNKNLLLFIEEPELKLHPGMQRKLIEILYDKEITKQTQFFMTTHSNHLLDMTLDSNNISVYTFHKSLDENVSRQKKAKVKVMNVASEGNPSLELLGVRNSAVFLTNCTIWIEGITDRLYIRKYLQVYQEKNEVTKKYKEDIHYSFVEYSGNNITHWNFLDEDGMSADNLCGKLFLISDLDGMEKDDSGEWTTIKGKRHEKLEAVLKDRYICLECREIENLLSPKILTSVICEYEKVESLNEDDLEGELIQDEYAHKLLGEYIEEKLKNKKRRGSYKSDSGTISDKVNFCKKAIDKIKSFDDLSPEAQQLTEKLYQFIEKNNN